MLSFLLPFREFIFIVSVIAEALYWVKIEYSGNTEMIFFREAEEGMPSVKSFSALVQYY